MDLILKEKERMPKVVRLIAGFRSAINVDIDLK